MAFVRVSHLVARVLGVAMGVFPLAAPEHVHETEDRGHTRALVHRHLPVHGLTEHHSDRDSTTVDHDDDPVLTLSAVYYVGAPFAMVRPLLSVAARLDPPEPRRIERKTTHVEILIHGPPRAPTGLRAPPCSPTA
jgi:hypothetical protein